MPPAHDQLPPPLDPSVSSGDRARGPDGRPSWHDYFMRFARDASTRGSCDRLRVGCVLVRERRVLATGYNGAPSGVEHCTEAGHDLDSDQHCTRAVHAEVNALLQCAAFGVAAEGSTAYVTALPCWRCYSALHQARVRRVVFDGEYRPDPRVLSLRERIGSFAPKLERYEEKVVEVVRALPGGATLRLTNYVGGDRALLEAEADGLAARLSGGPVLP